MNYICDIPGDKKDDFLISVSLNLKRPLCKILSDIYELNKNVPCEFFIVECSMEEMNDDTYSVLTDDDEKLKILENKSHCLNFKLPKEKDYSLFNFSCVYDSRDDASGCGTILPSYSLFSQQYEYAKMIHVSHHKIQGMINIA